MEDRRKMKLTITSATKILFGEWDLIIQINGKKYQYNLNDYDYNRVMMQYRLGHYGKMLNVLREG